MVHTYTVYSAEHVMVVPVCEVKWSVWRLLANSIFIRDNVVIANVPLNLVHYMVQVHDTLLKPKDKSLCH